MMFHRILLLAVALFLAACGSPKKGPRDAAVEFFEKCATGRTGEAYASAAQVFQLERTQKYFEARVRDLGLDQVKAVTWGEAEARGDTHRVKGFFRVNNNEPLEMEVSLALENGAWRVVKVQRETPKEDIFAVVARSSDVESERTKSVVEPVATAIPPERQLQQLVEKTLLSFDDALKREDFTDFHATVSDRWKYRGKDPRALTYAGTDPRRIEESDPMNKAGRLTLARLKIEFASFIAAKVDLSPIKGKPITFNEPAHITSDGVLTLSGQYKDFIFQGGFPPQAKRLSFKLEYVFEGSSWRLFGITLNVVTPQ